MIIISGPQLWKLDGNTLLNKEGLWMSDEKWNIKTLDGELVKNNNVKRQQECANIIIFQVHKVHNFGN